MKNQYDFSNGKRGAMAKVPPEKSVDARRTQEGATYIG